MEQLDIYNYLCQIETIKSGGCTKNRDDKALERDSIYTTYALYYPYISCRYLITDGMDVSKAAYRDGKPSITLESYDIKAVVPAFDDEKMQLVFINQINKQEDDVFLGLNSEGPIGFTYDADKKCFFSEKLQLKKALSKHPSKHPSDIL